MPFDTLKEQLLKGGIAPRRVRRYLGELDDHLINLTEQERLAGYDPAEAEERARALLGSDAELAQAWLCQPKLKSLTARAPWLVFGVLPPLEFLLGIVVVLLTLVAIGVAGGALPPHSHHFLSAPGWFLQITAAGVFLINFAVGPLLAWGLAWTAERQRLHPAWPVLAMAIIAAFGLHMMIAFKPNSIQVGLTSILPFLRPLGGPRTLQWPLFLTQTLLIALPGVWLIWRQKARTSGVACET